jgi:dTDP-4-dehydrorhamnose 3,5-epimerase
MELFRADELDTEVMPVLSYISMTVPGMGRGPHEHADQADLFCFAGPSDFRLYLWDKRKGSPTFGNSQQLVFGETDPAAVIVPCGVVHGYKNVGERDGLVVNCPNRLFKGKGKTGPVDETRYEEDDDSPFHMD